jgi:hypothetical protein
MNALFFKITLICYFLGTLAFLAYLLAGKKETFSR